MLETFEFKSIIRCINLVAYTLKSLQNLEKHELKFQSLKYVNIKICTKLPFEVLDTAHYGIFIMEIRRGLEEIRNFISFKCPNLRNPIQMEMYQTGSWYVAEFESKDLKISPEL